ncbi:hypothetical protein ACFLXQ_06760 [Chloroflexota bacterium]
MKSTLRILIGLISLSLVGLFLLWPTPNTDSTRFRAPQQTESEYSFENTRLGRVWSSVQSQDQQGPTVSAPVSPGLSPAVRDLSIRRPEAPVLDREINPRQNPDVLKINPDNPDPYDTGEPDPLVHRSRNPSGRTPAIDTGFEGTSLASGGSGIPPDTVGDIGPNHYVQMVNSSFAIYNKSGTKLTGPTNINQLWTGQGNDCENSNAGDPIVLYDRLADRWLLSQFKGGGSIANGLCFAISTSPDPGGTYYLYSFDTLQFPDYFKVGVWPDAYYVGANEYVLSPPYATYAFDRAQMLAGNPATFVRFAQKDTNFLLPADFDGATSPPAGSPGYFYTFKDNNSHGGSDRLEIFEFDVDFVTPGNSTFTNVDTINITSFTYTVCGFFNMNCIPQPGTSRKLDPVSEWPMWRLQYRNFGTYQTMVGNFTVDVSGSNQAGLNCASKAQAGLFIRKGPTHPIVITVGWAALLWIKRAIWPWGTACPAVLPSPLSAMLPA